MPQRINAPYVTNKAAVVVLQRQDGCSVCQLILGAVSSLHHAYWMHATAPESRRQSAAFEILTTATAIRRAWFNGNVRKHIRVENYFTERCHASIDPRVSVARVHDSARSVMTGAKYRSRRTDGGNVIWTRAERLRVIVQQNNCLPTIDTPNTPITPTNERTRCEISPLSAPSNLSASQVSVRTSSVRTVCSVCNSCITRMILPFARFQIPPTYAFDVTSAVR
jgi:hypothetical protein